MDSNVPIKMTCTDSGELQAVLVTQLSYQRAPVLVWTGLFSIAASRAAKVYFHNKRGNLLWGKFKWLIFIKQEGDGAFPKFIFNLNLTPNKKTRNEAESDGNSFGYGSSFFC